MSLFGSGRREGVVAASALVLLALGVHALGAFTGLGEGFEGDRVLARSMDVAHRLVAAGELPLWDPAGAGAPLWARGAELLYPPWWLLGRGADAVWLPVLAAVHAALACALAFRFLRAQGRSRYAAFVAGAAYGLGAHVGSLAGNLPEMAALAWAPLPIEVMLRVVRGSRNRHLAAWLGPALTVPFLTGGTATAACVTVIVILWLLRRCINEPERRPGLVAMGLGAVVTVLLLTAPLWLGVVETVPAASPPPPPPDLAVPLQRVAGPLLVFLATLGLIRRQREAPAGRWLPVAFGGATCAVLLPYVPSPLPGVAPWIEAPAALWWPVHLALVLLAASGLDDFLHLPMRRRAATAWALALATMIAVLGFVLGEDDTFFQVQFAVLLALALLFAGWRHLGILGFKTVVAAAALAWLSTATLHEQARAVRDPTPMPVLVEHVRPGAPPAAPGLETVTPLRAPTRARIEFDLEEARPAAAGPVPLPHPRAHVTGLRGLPEGWRARRDGRASVRLRAEGATWAQYDIEMHEGTGALVVAETPAPGWRATSAGRPLPVLRADPAGRAVLLGPGRHEVLFEYRPLALEFGLPLAQGGLTLAFLWGLAALVQRLLRQGRTNRRRAARR